MIDSNVEPREAQLVQALCGRAENLGFDHVRARADYVDVALKKLSVAPLARRVGAPYRLDLIALEHLRQLVLVRCVDARQRHRQVVAQTEIGQHRFGPRSGCSAATVHEVRGIGDVRSGAAQAVHERFASQQDLEQQLVAFIAILAEQGVEALEGRRLQRIEAVTFEYITDNRRDVAALAHVEGKEIARTLGGL